MLKVEYPIGYLKLANLEVTEPVKEEQSAQQSTKSFQPKPRVRRQYSPNDNNLQLLSLIARYKQDPALINDIKGLLNKVDINYRDKDGDTFLHAAIQEGHQDVVKLILEKEANIDIENNAGKTPLSLANELDNGNPNKQSIIQMLDPSRQKDDKRKRKQSPFDQDNSSQFAEKTLNQQDYQVWLTQEDVANIARVKYGWHGEDNNVIFEIIGSVEQLGRQLTQQNIDKLTKSNKQSLTFIVNLDNLHWVTLVIIYSSQQFSAYYIDSLAGEIQGNIRDKLSEKITGINTQFFKTGQQNDGHNCGIFALENAKIINDVIESGQIDQIEQKLKGYKPTSDDLENKRKEFAKALTGSKEDSSPERRKISSPDPQHMEVDEELKTDIDLQNNQGNTDLHKYASLGNLEIFKASFERLKKGNPNNYLEIVSKYNHYDETALSLAIENENFDIAIWLLNQLNSKQIDEQFDILVSVNSEKFDKFFDYARSKDEDKIIKSLSHIASELKLNRHGGDYQLKSLMLFAYESHSSDIRFRLGTEVHEANKFDDLVLRYYNNGVIKYRFLQAKHMQFLGEENKIKVSDLKSDRDNNNFSLQKYFVSYLKNKEEFRDGVLEDFIICTNTDFDFEPSTTKNEQKKTTDSKKKWKAYFSEKIDDDKVLNLGGKRYQFNKDPSIRTKIISELKTIFQESLKKNKLSNDGIDEKIGAFLDKLVFAVKQPSSILLSKKIKEKMGSDTYNFIYFATFKEYIDEWFASRESDNTARFILSSEIKEFFNRLKNKIANIELSGLASLFKEKIEKFTQQGLEFYDHSGDLSEVENFLNSNNDRILKLTYKEKDSLLSLAKVYQILKKKYQDTTKYTVSDLYSLSSLNFDDSNQERVVNALKSENKCLLVIECNFIDEDGKRLISKLYTEVLAESVSSKKVILVLNEELNNELGTMFPDLSKALSSTPVGTKNSLNSFTLKSKNTILKTEITLFGKKRKLTSLTTDASKDDLYSAIDGDALTTLINGDSNVIGSEHGYDFDIYIDIPRTLTYQTKIDKKCLKENKNDLFAISRIEDTELSPLVPEKQKIRKFEDKDPNKKDPIRFIILDNHRDIKEDFGQLCRDHKKHNIHLLENEDSVLEWKQSHGSLFNLRRFVLKEEEHTKQIKDLTDSAIIAGEAGMGKSTILTTYSMGKDFLWPIRINLKDYQTDIDNANFDDLSGIVKFLSNVIDPASSKTSLINDLLQYCLKQQGQVTLLLDGYDEIKDHSQKKVELLLRTLKTTQGKVLITTRSYARPGLEDALGIFAHSLNPFSEEEQKEFLKNFWIERLNIKEATQKDKIDKFTERLLIYFHESNLMKKEGLVGIALQARMVAEIFQDKCKEYLEHEQFSSYDFGISNISDLYEKFTEYQYERYLKEKIEISGKLSEGSRISLTRSYTKAYGNLALKSLFSEDQIQELLRKERFLGEELQDIGLVKTLKNDGTADFLHPTYAEYFVADFLVNALRKEKDHSKYRAVDNFLRMQIFRDHNKLIHDFIENKIKKESDRNLSSKWKAIQDCNLLGKVKNIVKLQLQKSISVPDHLNPTDDALSEKSLSHLQQDVEECMNWQGDRYYYNGDEKLINKLFQRFLRETDIKALETTLEFLLKANGKSYYGKANAMFSSGNNIDRAIEHYFSEFKKKGTISSLPNNLRNDYIKVKINNEKVFTKLEKILEKLTNINNKEKYLEKLICLLIPESITSIETPKELNNLCYSLDIVYPNIIDDVKSYIKSTEDTKKKYAKRIIDSLKDINCGNCGYINHDLENSSNLKSLQSFFIDILYHPSVIAYTKSSINEIYKDKKLSWLERQGVLISRVLEIITPEMSERFNSVLDGKIDGGTRIYSDGIFVDLINYVVNRIGEEELPQIDKLAFLKMLVRFVGFSVEEKRELPFTSEQLKITLKLIKDMLNEQLQPTLVVSESIEYLHILGKAGLKLIDAKKELLVLDPAGEFEYKLSSDYIKQIIELIKWRSENSSKTRKEFLKKCYETVELKKGNLNRKGSEGDLQELEQLKVKSCLLNRRKREAAKECLFTWEDVDEFNEEKDEKRDLSKIKIDGEKFISYIKDLPEEKQSQLIQLASGVKVTGESQSLVNKLISNQKVINHLGRVGKFSGITMHGMMAKNVLADAVNGNYQGLAINLGFIALPYGVKAGENAALKGLHSASEIAYARGFKLAPLVESSLAQSFRLSSAFLARGTSAFVVYDLVNQIKALTNGTEEALVGVVGDSIYLGVDAAEIGVEVAESFAVLEGVSSVTGPIGAAVGAVVFVGTDVYMAVKKVGKIDQIIHLTEDERFVEGLRAFIGIQPEQYIEELMEKKQLYNQLVKQGLEYLKGHSDIQSYVFPTTDKPDLDSKVLLERKRSDIRWSRARPDDLNEGRAFCLPQGNDEPAPSYGSYLCENAIGVFANKTGNHTLINLGEGKDYAKGFLNSPNIFAVNNGFKEYYGGSKDDIFVLQAEYIKGHLFGEGGINTLDTTFFALQQEPLNIQLEIGEIADYFRDNSLKICEINKVIGRANKAETITVSCDGCNSDVKLIDGQSGNKEIKDRINIIDDSCDYQMQIVVRPNTVVYNRALKGSFDYLVPLNSSGSAELSFIYGPERFNVNNTFWFAYEAVNIKSIDVKYINVFNRTEHEVKFNFVELNKEFNLTISYPENPFYRIGKSGEIRIGNKGNLYMLESTDNKSSEEVIRDYVPIANRVSKMSFFIQSLLSNETVVIGSGNHEVIHNNPAYRSHLVGNGGENVYVIDSETTEVIIHDIDEENSIDTIDLRNVVKKGNYELKVTRSENDLLLRATGEGSLINCTVRLKDGVERYNKTHVILENVPMTISFDNNEWSLKPQPLIFEEDKEIIVVTGQDVEEGNEIITPRKGGNYKFVRSNDNDLMITNAFDLTITKNDLCTITLSQFYETPRMKTLFIKFADKEIVLKDHEKEISAARNINTVKKEYKDKVHDDVFNPEVIMLSDQPHRHRHEHSRHTRHRRSTTSSSTRPTAWINDLFGWVKSSVSGLLGSKSESTPNPISQLDAQMDVNGTIMLLDVIIRKFTGKQYIPAVDQSIPLLEARGYALNITNRFEKVLNKTAIKSGISVTNLNFDPVVVQSAIIGKIINGRSSEIAKTLYSFAKEACPEFKQTDKFLDHLRSNLKEEKGTVMLQQKVEKPYKDLSQEVSRKVQLSKKPNTFLNGTSVVQGISRGIN